MALPVVVAKVFHRKFVLCGDRCREPGPRIDVGSMGWESLFAGAGITPIRVVYEDLVADYGAEMRRLFDELGLEAVVDPVPPTPRQGDATSAEWVERFRASMPLA